MEETKTQLTYNPYKIKDFRKMQEKQPNLAKGLGSNIGDERWQLANEKQERLKKYSQNLKMKGGDPNADKVSDKPLVFHHVTHALKPPVEEKPLNRQNLEQIPKAKHLMGGANSDLSDELSLYKQDIISGAPKDNQSRKSTVISKPR